MKYLASKKKRILFGLAALLLIFVSALGLRSALSSVAPYEPEDTVMVMDDGRSQVYVSGNTYKLNDNTKKEHKENQEKRSEVLRQQEISHQQTEAQKRIASTRGTNPVKTTKPVTKKPVVKKPAVKPKTPVKPPAPVVRRPTNPSKPSTNDPDDDDEEDYYKKPENARKLLPTIKTSLRDGQKIKGDKISFWVTATDYKKQNIPVFSNGSGKFEVYLNGTKLTSTGASGKKTNFRPTGKDGKNTIKITATDRKGNKRSITRRVTCNIKEEAKIIGTVYVSISAPSLGIGTIESGIPVKITEEEPLHDVLEAAFKAKGFSYKMTSSYLAGIKKSGIAKDAEISDELRERAEELSITIYEREKWPDGWKNRLYEKDFASTSGWIYRVNGEAPEVGINSFIPNDGDEIELLFSLFDGDID